VRLADAGDETISACKMQKIRDFNVDFFEHFSAGIAPRPSYWGGTTAPLPDPTPRHSGVLRLPRLPSVPPSTFRPCAVEMRLGSY